MRNAFHMHSLTIYHLNINKIFYQCNQNMFRKYVSNVLKYTKVLTSTLVYLNTSKIRFLKCKLSACKNSFETQAVGCRGAFATSLLFYTDAMYTEIRKSSLETAGWLNRPVYSARKCRDNVRAVILTSTGA